MTDAMPASEPVKPGSLLPVSGEQQRQMIEGAAGCVSTAIDLLEHASHDGSKPASRLAIHCVTGGIELRRVLSTLQNALRRG